MKTVEVRIAVAVCSQGHWNAASWNDGRGVEGEDVAVEGLECGCPTQSMVFVKAKVPLPSDIEIQGVPE